MSREAPRLPMELWARIAHFLPFEQVLPTFWALRRALVLPYTHTPPANALLQFCADLPPPPPPPPPTIAPTFRSGLRDVGFSDAEIDEAVRLCHGHDNAIVEFLLTRYE